MPDSEGPRRSTGRTLSNQRRQELKDEPYNQPSEIELTQERLDFVRQAGASEEFLTMLTVDPEEHGVSRNYPRGKIQGCIYYGDLDGDPESFEPNGEGCFPHLWDGDLYEAFRRADFQQAPLLKSVFGEERINAARSDPEAPLISELTVDRFFVCTHPQGNFDQ